MYAEVRGQSVDHADARHSGVLHTLGRESVHKRLNDRAEQLLVCGEWPVLAAAASATAAPWSPGTWQTAGSAPLRSTVHLVDSDEKVRQLVATVVEEKTNLRLAVYARGEEFLECYDACCPGLLILDNHLPGMSGIELQQELCVRQIELPIIFATACNDVPTAVTAMQRGAVDFLQKPVSPDVLIDRLVHAMQLDTAWRQERATAIVLRDRIARLKPRERRIMELMVSGRSSKQIAAQLKISLPAVSKYRSRVFDVLRVENVVVLTRLLGAHLG